MTKKLEVSAGRLGHPEENPKYPFKGGPYRLNQILVGPMQHDAMQESMADRHSAPCQSCAHPLRAIGNRDGSLDAAYCRREHILFTTTGEAPTDAAS